MSFHALVNLRPSKVDPSQDTHDPTCFDLRARAPQWLGSIALAPQVCSSSAKQRGRRDASVRASHKVGGRPERTVRGAHGDHPDGTIPSPLIEKPHGSIRARPGPRLFRTSQSRRRTRYVPRGWGPARRRLLPITPGARRIFCPCQASLMNPLAARRPQGRFARGFRVKSSPSIQSSVWTPCWIDSSPLFPM